MTVNISKPAVNVRSKLAELDKPTGIAGEAMLRAETPQEQFNLIGAGRRNLIINGDMRIAQRGASSTSPNYQTVDRFRNGFGGVSVTQSQENVSTGDAPFRVGFRKFLRLTQTAAGSASTDFAQISQRIEGLSAGASGWDFTSANSHITVSAWVRSSLAGTYYLYLQTRSSTSGYINVPFTLAANVWAKVEFVISGNDGCFIDYDNTSGIECRFIPYYGSGYTSNNVQSNSWYFDVTGGELPNFSQNWCATSGATFDITGVQLELGKIATPFEHRSYGEELALCERYYQLGGLGATGAFYSTNGTALTVASSLRTTMRATPAISMTTGALTIDEVGVAARTFTNTTASPSAFKSARGFQVYGMTSSTNPGVNVGAQACMTQDYLKFDAEL